MTLDRLRADYDRKTHLAKFSGPTLGKTQAQWRREADEAWRAILRHVRPPGALG